MFVVKVACFIALSLAACSRPVKMPIAHEVSDTSSNTSSVSPAPSKPLQLGEIIINDVSVDDIVARFGVYTRYETAYYPFPGNGCHYIRLFYPGLSIELESYFEDGRYSFGGNRFEYGERDNPLSETDRSLPMWAVNILWTEHDLEGPRGIKIGDSEAEVRAKYLDLSARYNDGKTLYALADVHPETPESAWGYLKSGGETQILTAAQRDAKSLNITAENALAYYEVDPPFSFEDTTNHMYGYQFSLFYFSGGKLTAIEQGYSRNTP
jgi:hypothetical protein